MTGRLVLCLLVLYAVLICGDLCGQSEYLSSAGECCPMCNIGLIVMKDCTGHSSTTCKPCASGMYMNEPNGLQQCFPCTTCDNGLYVSRECTRIQNAVCDVQDGYYCEVYSGTECSVAVKHRVCVPGQQVKTPGNKVSDTVCEDCLPGFYSLEGVNCTKWTDCSVKQQILDKEGSSIKDVECKDQRHNYFLIGTCLLAAAVLVFLFITYLITKSIYGLAVLRNCSFHSMMTCKPCEKGTYLNEPNGHSQCFPCTCANGLYVSRECTRIHNAVSDVHDGYCCDVPSGTECSVAVKHRVCLPGQQIKTPETKSPIQFVRTVHQDFTLQKG